MEHYMNSCSSCGDNSCEGYCVSQTQIPPEYNGGMLYNPLNPIPTVCILGCQKVYGSDQTKLVQFWITRQQQEALKRRAQEEQEVRRAQKLAETFAWISRCEQNKGLCGCTECKELHKFAQKRGVKDFELLNCKLMDLDNGEFYWDKSCLSMLFGVEM
jgi:hypothetical protein